jgi:superfamily I DNA/RNA helicase
VPVVRPVSCGREGQEALIIRLPKASDEPAKIADVLASAHEEGFAWGDMAVLCRKQAQLDEVGRVLKARKLPHKVRKSSGDFDPLANTIKVMTMHVSKGLEFPVVALCGVGQMPGAGEDEKEEARLFYVAATRATQKLIIAADGQSQLAQELLAGYSSSGSPIPLR